LKIFTRWIDNSRPTTRTLIGDAASDVNASNGSNGGSFLVGSNCSERTVSDSLIITDFDGRFGDLRCVATRVLPPAQRNAA